MTQPMFESENIYDLGWIQIAKARGPTRTVKTIEKPLKNTFFTEDH